MDTQKFPTTLFEAAKMFYSDSENCLNVFVSIRWPAGISCPYCTAFGPSRIKERQLWQCKSCRKQFSLKTGTIFEDSPVALGKWFLAMWLIANCKNGISSYELSRHIGVMQRTAWFMNHRLRLAMANGSFEKMSGTIESDETYIGGLEKNKHKSKKLNAGRGCVGKSVVMGLIERSEVDNGTSRVKAEVIPVASAKHLHSEIRSSVTEFSKVYTDAWKGYHGLSAEYLHEFVDHTVAYAIGQVHTNGVENFWALLKRGLSGTYVSVEPFHLKSYIDEQVYRFNNRGTDDAGRFLTLLAGVTGKRLTYDELTHRFESYYDQVLPRQDGPNTATF